MTKPKFTQGVVPDVGEGHILLRKTLLEKVARRIVRLHQIKAASDKRLKKERAGFFQLVDGAVAEDEYPLQRQTLDKLIDMSDNGVKRLVAAEYPEWRLVEITATDFTIEEDPSKRRFAVPIEDLGLKVQRSTALVKQELDADALHLFVHAQCRSNKIPAEKRAMFQSLLGCLKERTVFDFDEEEFKKTVDKYPDSMAVLQDYISAGQIQTRLIVSKLEEE